MIFYTRFAIITRLPDTNGAFGLLYKGISLNWTLTHQLSYGDIFDFKPIPIHVDSNIVVNTIKIAMNRLLLVLLTSDGEIYFYNNNEHTQYNGLRLIESDIIASDIFVTDHGVFILDDLGEIYTVVDNLAKKLIFDVDLRVVLMISTPLYMYFIDTDNNIKLFDHDINCANKIAPLRNLQCINTVINIHHTSGFVFAIDDNNYLHARRCSGPIQFDKINQIDFVGEIKFFCSDFNKNILIINKSDCIYVASITHINDIANLKLIASPWKPHLTVINLQFVGCGFALELDNGAVYDFSSTSFNKMTFFSKYPECKNNLSPMIKSARSMV